MSPHADKIARAGRPATITNSTGTRTARAVDVSRAETARVLAHGADNATRSSAEYWRGSAEYWRGARALDGTSGTDQQCTSGHGSNLVGFPRPLQSRLHMIRTHCTASTIMHNPASTKPNPGLACGFVCCVQKETKLSKLTTHEASPVMSASTQRRVIRLSALSPRPTTVAFIAN